MGDLPIKALIFGALAIVAVAAGAGIGMMKRSGQQALVSNEPVFNGPPSSEQPGSLEVHVAGWVVSPGVVTVREGSIVAEAIDAAGGLRQGARADLINLAATVADGDQVVVPGPGEGGPTGEFAEGGPAGDGLLSLNRATAADLETLPGVGPVLAERIVSHREANGGFEQVEDLLEVPGIGEAKLASIRDLVRP